MASIKSESKLLAKHSLIYGTGTVINRLVSILLLPLYTQYLSPTDYGIKDLVGLSVDVVGTLVAITISTGLLRFYFEEESDQYRNSVISTATIGISALSFLALFILFFFTKPMAKYIIDSPDLYYYFNIALISMWLNTINQIGFGYLRAKQKSVSFVIFTVSRLLGAVGLNIYFIVFLELGVLGVLLSNLIVAIISTCALNLPILIKVGFHFSNTLFKDMLRFGIPLIPAQIGSFIVHLSDRFFLKAYTSVAEVGIYSLGYKFGVMPSTFVSVPFNQIWQARRFELYKTEGSEELFGKIFTYYIVLICFFGLAVATLSREVIRIMADPNFWSAYAIVPIIVLANIIFSFNSHLNMGIMITKKTKLFAYIGGSSGLLILLLNFLLIPRFGMYGAAYATLLAFLYRTFLVYFVSSRFYKIHLEFKRIAVVFSSAFVIFFLCFILDIQSIYLSFLAKLFLVLLFPAILWLFGFFSPEERKLFKNFVTTTLSFKQFRTSE